jgi:repressor LexA
MNGIKLRAGTDDGDEQRRKITRFVREFTQREGYSPSYREIAEGIGLAVSTVCYHVAILKKQGAVRRGPGQPRTITWPAEAAFPARDDTVDVPLLGQIPAGTPVDALLAAAETFRLPRWLAGHGTVFMLRVRGDSMTGAAITDGDLIVVRQQPTAENGEIVAAQFTQGESAEATVKTLQFAGGHPWLMPSNPAYQPIPADEAVILGKVVAVLRTGWAI